MPKRFSGQFPIRDSPRRLWEYHDVLKCVLMLFPIAGQHRPLGIRDKDGNAANRSLYKLTKGGLCTESQYYDLVLREMSFYLQHLNLLSKEIYRLTNRFKGAIHPKIKNMPCSIYPSFSPVDCNPSGQPGLSHTCRH